jgi:hypothetical protein
MRPGFWTSLILLIPGVRQAYDIAAEKSLEAAHHQGEILAMRARLEALETERLELNREKDRSYKLVINVFSQYAWGKKQFEDVGGMPEEFHPQQGVMPSESVNASAIVAKRHGQAMEEFFRDMDKVGSD